MACSFSNYVPSSSHKKVERAALNVFRFDEPASEDLEAFHRDGYIAYPDVFTAEAREGLMEEIHNFEPVNEFLGLSDEERGKLEQPDYYTVRPWNERGPWADALIDAPLVTALLNATVGQAYHFCHSALNVALRGAERVGFHMDHHHWFHENPINLAEREKWYVQILYYANGFTLGDRNLCAIPGSHRVSPTKDVTPEKLLNGEFDDQAGRKLEVRRLELPPGSFVYLNARMFHGVEPKPPDSPQAHRIFVIDIFKEAGPPHRYTQEIADDWMERAGPERRRLFERKAYTPECWLLDGASE